MSDTQSTDEKSRAQAAPNEAASEIAGAWSSGRKAIAYQEGRAVLQGQQTTAQNLDKKGLRTTQFIVALAGVVASFIKILSVSVVPFWLYVSIASVFVAFAASLATYNTSRTVMGPDHDYLKWFAFHEFGEEEDPWEDQLLDEIATWIDQNNNRIETNVHLLLASNIALLCAIITLAIGAIA